MTALITVENDSAHAVYASQKPSNKGRPRSSGIAEIIDKTTFVEPEVNGCQLMDMTGFHVKPFTIGVEYGRRNVFFNMHFGSFQPRIDPSITVRR
jgi:hypothetical protein